MYGIGWARPFGTIHYITQDKQQERAVTVEQQRNNRRLRPITQRMPWLENEVHQAMAVMDAETGKLLNYS